MSQAAAMPRDITAEPRQRSRHAIRLLRPLLMLGGIAAVAVGVGYWWLTGGRVVAIDDAYVQADKVAISTDVSGMVAAVPVHEGQLVHKGDVLFRLEQRRFRIALDGAKAKLAQTALTLQAAERDYHRMESDVAMRQAAVADDQANYQRYANLVRGGGVTRQEYDNARFKLAADKAALEAAQVQAEVQLARLGGNADADVTTLPAYKEAQAAVDEAQRQLDHTVVHAPFDGIVTHVDALQPGMYLTASTGAFGLVSTDHVWVEGNPKETELTWVRPGDPARVTVDTYPGQVWTGTVESIAPASGSEFSVLPAQNTSGNWVKVVQRIPLRVRVERRPGDPPLRAGMSVEIGIDTGHQRRLADLF
ncbi:MAG TPA: HlyD family secretion protein [Acetobacteraceae bacterium]|nr:HlyD family secretion protein [Acetobacteraceae bacterium]